MATGINSSSSFYTFNHTPSKSSKNNVLECRVCEDVFALHGEKVPRLLLCGHTLCHQCLIRLVHHHDTISCPFDRQPTPIHESGVWGLKKNFALLELLERLQYTGERPSLLCNEFPDLEKESSIPCDEDDCHKASIYCTVCSTNLCQECSERTHSMKTLAKHKRIPLSEKPREKPRCIYHPDHLVEFACIEEECQASPLMCYICKDYGRHQKHRHSLLDQEAENIRFTVSNAVQHMRIFLEDVNESTQKINHLVQLIEGQSQSFIDDEGTTNQQWITGSGEEARNRVTSYFNDLRETLNLQEVAALTVVDTHIRERVCSLRQQQEDMSSLQMQVSSICLKCDRAVRQDDARVLLASRELKALLETVQGQQQQFSDLPFNNFADSSIPITFTRDNRVHIGPKIEMRVVILGLDDSGKTSILYKLKQNEFMPTIPTIGFNVETVECRNLKFTIWDVGGQRKLRPLWRHYYLNTQAIIFVIDSSNRNKLEEAHSELSKLLSEKELKEASLLVFANKQDLPECMTIEEITDILSLYKLCCGRSWHIQACDAQSGTGLYDGLDWLARQLIAAGVTGIA